MTDGTKDWANIRIEEPVRDAASDDPRTYTEIMRAGLTESGVTDAAATIEAAEIRQILREELDAMSVDVSVDLSDADLPSGSDVSEEDIRIWIRDEIEQNVVEQAREVL